MLISQTCQEEMSGKKAVIDLHIINSIMGTKFKGMGVGVVLEC